LLGIVRRLQLRWLARWLWVERLERLHFSVFKMADVRHLGFLKFIFEHSLGFGGPMCVSMQNFLEIGRTIAEIYQFIHFSKMAAVGQFGFVGQILGRPTMRI